MVNLTAITDKLWTDVCPISVYGNSTGTDTAYSWDSLTSFALSAHQTGWVVSGVFATIDSLFAFVLILQHLRHYTKPQFQRYHVRIILMVPVYSIVSFLGYRFYDYAAYFRLGLSVYEAIVITSFFILILNMLSDKEGRVKDILSRGKRHAAVFPLCCVHFYTDSWWFLEVVKWSILQYVVVQPLTAITGVVLEATGHLCAESWSLKLSEVWIKVVEFCSVTIASYVLIQFYIIIRRDIASFKPLWKFLAIKLIVFLSFYQSMCLSILGYAGVIRATEYWTQANVEYGLNSLLITVEMFLFCFLNMVAYPHKEFIPTSPSKMKRLPSVFHAAVDALNIFDLFVEVGRNLRWFWRAIVLRRKDIRHPHDARFDIHASDATRAELNNRETREFLRRQQVDRDGDGGGKSPIQLATGPRGTHYRPAETCEDDSDDGGLYSPQPYESLQYPPTTHQLGPLRMSHDEDGGGGDGRYTSSPFPMPSADGRSTVRLGNGDFRHDAQDFWVSEYARATRQQSSTY